MTQYKTEIWKKITPINSNRFNLSYIRKIKPKMSQH